MSDELKVPINYPEAEKAALGCMMMEHWATRRGLQLLKMGDFYGDDNRRVFEAITNLLDEFHDAKIDLVSVGARLKTMRGDPGQAYLSDCLHAIGSAAHMDYYIKLVVDASIQRQIDQQLTITAGERTPENVKALGDLILALQGNRGAKIFTMAEDLGPMIDEITSKPEPGIKTGLSCVDNLMTGNLHGGELWTIGARPGGGKTALMLKLAGLMANQGIPVLYLTSEMRTKELIQRLLPMATGIPHHRFRTCNFTDLDYRKINDAAATMSEMTFAIAHYASPSIKELMGAVYQAKPQVVFIDYLQRFYLPRAENMAYQIAEFYRQLKSFLLDVNVIGFIGCQSDRDLDKNPTAKPTMSHLKGSGGIESESDGVMMLWEPPAEVIAKMVDWVPPRPDCRGMELIFRKNRNGPKDVSADLELNGTLIDMCERRQQPSEELI